MRDKKMKITGSIFSILLLTVTTPLKANTDSPLSVTVFGDRLEEHSISGVPALTITREQIKASGAQSIVDALRASGLVFIGQSYTGNKRDNIISMGGFGENASQNVLILVDGQKLNTPTLEAVDLGLIPISDVNQIDILDSSAGVLYGESAVGGVINIHTTPTLADAHSIRLTTDSYDTQNATINIARMLGDSTGIKISASRDKSANYRDNSDSLLNQARFSVNHQTNNLALKYNFTRSVSDQRLPGSLSGVADPRSTQTPDDYSDKRLTLHSLNLKNNFSDSGALIVDLSFSKSDIKAFYGDYGYGSFTQLQTTKNSSLDSRLENTNHFGRYLVGFELTKGSYQTSETGYQSTASIYGNQIIELSDTSNLTLGMRSIEVRDTKKEGDKNNGAATLGSIGYNIQATDSIRLYSKFDQSTRFATIDELNSASPNFLKPQKSLSKIVGAKIHSSGLEYTLEYSRTDISNEIYFDPTIGSSPGSNVNLPDSERSKLKLAVNGHFTDRTRFGATYTNTAAKYTSGSYAGSTVAWVPKHILTAYLFNRFNDNLSLYTDAQYTGSKFLANDYTNTSNKVDAYWLVNTNLKWERDSLELTFGIQNLFDQRHDAFASVYGYYPAPGRALSAGLIYNF